MKPRIPLLSTDTALVRRALAADTQALEALVLRYQTKVHAVAFGQGVPKHAVDDVVQESFLRAIRDLPQLRDHGAFGPWLLTIVRNVARDVLRSLAREGTEPLRYDVASGEPVEAETDSRERLWAKVAELPEATREAVFLYYHEGKSTRVVARALGISVTAVKSRLEHGRKLLRAKLWQEMEESFRRSMPSKEGWKRRGRQLTLGLLSAPCWSAAEARVGASSALSGILQGAGFHGLSIVGVLMSGKKIGFAIATLLLLLAGAAAWWTGRSASMRELSREEPFQRGRTELSQPSTRLEVPAEGKTLAVETPLSHAGSTIVGTVSIIERGRHAARAKVAAILSGEKRHAALVEAGDDGRFQMTGLGPGAYLLWAWRGTWTTAERPDSIELKEGGLPEEAHLILVPGAAVEVEVVGEGTGSPVAGALVQYKSLQFCTTDERGRCRLDGVPAGQIHVQVTAASFAVALRIVDVAPGEEAFTRAAGLEEFVASLPDRYEAMIGDRGANLSGGQRQRIAIARALLKDPDLFLFDEATSHLDTITEQAIQGGLRSRLAGKTVIVVAHRLSTIKDADSIYLLEDGRVAEEGTHQSLLALRGRYAALWQAQAGLSQEGRAAPSPGPRSAGILTLQRAAGNGALKS